MDDEYASDYERFGEVVDGRLTYSDACREEWCEDCDVDGCIHHCHDSVYFNTHHFDGRLLTWRRMENVAVTATDEHGEPLI